MGRVLCILIGYVFGLFETGYLYGKLHHVDIRTMGSGNAGATNTWRTFGLGAGFITFLGDFFKCVLAIWVVSRIFADNFTSVLAIYTGAGVVLGHNYPFYMNFRGGKGIAVMAGLAFSLLPMPLPLFCYGAFFVIVLITRFVSLGSLSATLIFLGETIYYGQKGGFGVSSRSLGEIYTIATFLVIMALWRHRGNIKRLVLGIENEFSFKKKGERE